MEALEENCLEGARQGPAELPLEHNRPQRRRRLPPPSYYRLPVSIFNGFFRLRRVWLSVFSLVFPLVLFCFLDSHDVRFRCLYVLCVMVSSWLTAAIDPVLVAIYPVVLCPLLGIAGVRYLAESYFRPISFLMFGASLVAAAFSRTGLDATISAFIFEKFRSNPPLLCLGLMLCSAVLSMWINNASTTVILSPIATHVLAAWAKSLGEAGELQRVLRGASEKNAAAESGRSISVASSARPGAQLGLRSLASTSAEAISSVVRSKEATTAHVGKVHEKSYNRRLPRTKKSSKSFERPQSGNDCRAETTARWTAHDARTTGIPRSAPALGCGPPAGGEGQDPDLSRARVPHTSTIRRHSTPSFSDTSSSASLPLVAEDKDAGVRRRLKNVVFLSIAYSATLGGMSTLNGSFVNPTLVQVLDSSYDFSSAPGQQNPVNFTSWMAFACPLAFLCVFLAWLALSSIWLGFSTTAHALARLLIKPFSSVLSAVKTLRGVIRERIRASPPVAVEPSAVCAAQDARGVHIVIENEVQVNRLGACCTPTETLERLPPDANIDEASIAPLMEAAEGHADATSKEVAGRKEQMPRTTRAEANSTLDPLTDAPVKESHVFAQAEVLLLLAVLVALWLTRSFGDGKGGWGVYFVPNFVDDSVPVLLLGLILFFLPLEAPDVTWNGVCSRTKRPADGGKDNAPDEGLPKRPVEGRKRQRSPSPCKEGQSEECLSREAGSCAIEQDDEDESAPGGDSQRMSCFARLRQECRRSAARRKEYAPILTYAYAIQHVEWGALLLLGGGFAMATSMKRTGLDIWIGNAVLRFAKLDRPALVICVLFLASCLTEITSNTATANVLIPIFNGVAKQGRDSPLLVLIPATVGAQLAFMLPLGTAPNAIVLKQGKIRPLDMFWTGLVVKVLAIGAALVAVMTWGERIFDLGTRPVWAD